MNVPSLYEFGKFFLPQLFFSILNHHIRPQMQPTLRYQFVMFQNILINIKIILETIKLFKTYFLYFNQAPGLGINLSRFPFLSLSDSILRIRYWWYEDKLFNNSIFFISKQRWNIFAFAWRSADVTGGIGLGLYGENPKKLLSIA